MTQQAIPFLIVGLIVLAIALMIGVAIASGRKNVEEKRQIAETLGFTPLDPLPADVVEHLIPLHQKGYHQRLEVCNIHRQSRPDCTLYLYDVWDVGGSDRDLVTASAVALVAPELDLPRFYLFPKVNVIGWTGTMANQFIEKLVGLHSQVIDFEQHPGFDKRYLVSGDDELTVRRYLNGPVLAALMQTEMHGLVLSAWGDALTITTMNVGTNRQEDPATDVRARRDLALTLYMRLADNWQPN